MNATLPIYVAAGGENGHVVLFIMVLILLILAVFRLWRP